MTISATDGTSGRPADTSIQIRVPPDGESFVFSHMIHEATIETMQTTGIDRMSQSPTQRAAFFSDPGGSNIIGENIASTSAGKINNPQTIVATIGSVGRDI